MNTGRQSTKKITAFSRNLEGGLGINIWGLKGKGVFGRLDNLKFGVNPMVDMRI